MGPRSPRLPEKANALLKARQKPLEDKGADDGEVRELREELTRLGVMVKDQKQRQYVRTFGPVQLTQEQNKDRDQ
ncbi:CysS/YqeB C-terminal domain-containing protein [Actinomadura vinacea]|uniref:CysS/YqeB C-terminal domain-containing protein n=1 Tax=Actinomadura vinacea TaxID=115336 RepID=UPI003CD075FF